MPYEKPNLVLPLAASFNTRGLLGYTNAVTNADDQLKINSVYDVVNNALTGASKVYLRKRPGFQGSSITGGSAAHIPYLALETPTTSNSTGVILDDGTDIKYYYDATNSTIRSNALKPVYADTTVISGANTAVVQFSDTVNANAYYSTNASNWTQISDADFTGLAPRGKMEFLDGFSLIMDSTNKIYNSDLNSISAWTSTSYISKSILQDEPMGLARLGRVILAFGKETVEGFYNAGNASGSPLGRIPQLSTRIGLYPIGVTDGRHYSAQIGNVLYFIGTENKKGGTTATPSVYAFDGSQFRRVSTNAVDKIIYQGGTFSTVTHVCAFPVVSVGICLAILLTGVSTATQQWLVYDPRSGEWFLWYSASTQPANDSGFFIGIGGVTGDKKFQYSTSAWQDNGSAYTMTHQFKLPSSGHNIKRMPYVGVIGDTQTSASTLQVSFSDDDYQTFSTPRDIDLTKVKKQIYRCGAYRDRAVKLEHSANTDCRLEAFIARVEE